MMLHTCIIPLSLGLGRLRQEDLTFEARMANMVRPCFKKKTVTTEFEHAVGLS